MRLCMQGQLARVTPWASSAVEPCPPREPPPAGCRPASCRPRQMQRRPKRPRRRMSRGGPTSEGLGLGPDLDSEHKHKPKHKIKHGRGRGRGRWHRRDRPEEACAELAEQARSPWISLRLSPWRGMQEPVGRSLADRARCTTAVRPRDWIPRQDQDQVPGRLPPGSGSTRSLPAPMEPAYLPQAAGSTPPGSACNTPQHRQARLSQRHRLEEPRSLSSCFPGAPRSLPCERWRTWQRRRLPGAGSGLLQRSSR